MVGKVAAAIDVEILFHSRFLLSHEVSNDLPGKQEKRKRKDYHGYDALPHVSGILTCLSPHHCLIHGISRISGHAHPILLLMGT